MKLQPHSQLPEYEAGCHQTANLPRLFHMLGGKIVEAI